jgi:hypothetical protein
MQYFLLSWLLLFSPFSGGEGKQGTQNSYYQEVGRRALEEVKWDWKTILSGWDLQFHPGRPGYLGLTSPELRQVDVWIRPQQSPRLVAATITHELAHVFDVSYLTESQRKTWYAVRGIPQRTPWFSCSLCSDYAYGQGDFAECVSWTLQGGSDKFRSRLGPKPTLDQQRLIRKWLSSATPNGRPIDRGEATTFGNPAKK